MIYKWANRKKRRGKQKKTAVHLKGEDGKSVCHVENNGVTLTEESDQYPKGRPACKNCQSVWKKGVRIPIDIREPDLKVLMGERV